MVVAFIVSSADGIGGNQIVTASDGCTCKTAASVNITNVGACDIPVPPPFDDEQILHSLYGEHFEAEKQGSGQILVLGAQNSRTSMTARMVMLLGAFGGNKNTIQVLPNNQLKYWERPSVFSYHHDFLYRHMPRGIIPTSGLGLNLKRVSQCESQGFNCFVAKELNHLERHQPWVIKDPRMPLLMELWRDKLTRPICLFVYKDPVQVSLHLAAMGHKSGHLTAEQWMRSWVNVFTNGFKGCIGAPTLIIDTEVMAGDLNDGIARLHFLLEAAGVKGLTIPSPNEVEEQIMRHIKPARTYATQANGDAPVKVTPYQRAFADAIRHYMQKIQENVLLVELKNVAADVLARTQVLHSEYQRQTS